METLLNENREIWNLEAPKAKDKNSQEEKAWLAMPDWLNYHLQTKKCSVTCIASFSQSSHQWAAVAYDVVTAKEETIHLIVVYNFQNLTSVRLLLARDKVMSLCVPEDSYLIAGTLSGSLILFDLHESTNFSIRVPTYESDEGVKHWFYEPTFITDGFES